MCCECEESFSEYYQPITLECACKIFPVCHKHCVKYACDKARLLQKKWTCSNCNTNIQYTEFEK